LAVRIFQYWTGKSNIGLFEQKFARQEKCIKTYQLSISKQKTWQKKNRETASDGKRQLLMEKISFLLLLVSVL
jgi:hypothetical protein